MRNSIKTLMALLIVFSAVAVNAADSVAVATICKIVPVKDDTYKVIYQAAKRQNVTIEIVDNKNQKVYSEVIKSEGFVKRFNLENLPVGDYQLKVKADNIAFQESIKLGDVSGFNLNFAPIKDREVALVGSHKDGKPMTIYILDEARDVVYKEEIADSKQIHKKFNFAKLEGDKVSFVVYHDDQLVKEMSFDF